MSSPAERIPRAGMQTVADPVELGRIVEAWRREGLTVGFVPTMGALHEGHLSLVRRARQEADRSVVSIFVNPAQFNQQADLDAYPRTVEQDAALLAAEGCDLVFLPTVEAIYPPGHATWVEVQGPPAEGLEGEHRPGHFRGVATVVTILFGLVRPDVAVFGRKDAQQLALVQQLTRDLALPVRIVPGETVREADGLAMSSRNVHLSSEERRAAAVLYRALSAARQAFEAGERSGDALRAVLRATLAAEPLAEVEYAEVVDAETFQPISEIPESETTRPIVMPLAVRIGETRLIDNIHLAPTGEAKPV